MATRNQFVQVPVGPGGWSVIKAEADALGGGLNSRTCMAGQRGNRHAAAGPAGEVAVEYVVREAQKVPGFKREKGNRDYDFVGPNGLKVDVKTRSCKDAPKDFFDVRVPCYSFEQQKCDIYVFTFAQWKHDDSAIERVWLVGWCTKAEFLTISEVQAVESAQGKASGFNQREGGADLRFTQISKLNPMATLKAAVGG